MQLIVTLANLALLPIIDNGQFKKRHITIQVNWEDWKTKQDQKVKFRGHTYTNHNITRKQQREAKSCSPWEYSVKIVKVVQVSSCIGIVCNNTRIIRAATPLNHWTIHNGSCWWALNHVLQFSHLYHDEFQKADKRWYLLGTLWHLETT